MSRSKVMNVPAVFNFINGQHDVLEVKQAEFNSCNISTTPNNPITSSPARVTLRSAGEHYYICAIPNHCSGGQKLAINVSNTGSSPTNPSPSPQGSNNAVSLSVAALPMGLLAVALALLHN